MNFFLLLSYDQLTIGFESIIYEYTISTQWKGEGYYLNELYQNAFMF